MRVNMMTIALLMISMLLLSNEAVSGQAVSVQAASIRAMSAQVSSNLLPSQSARISNKQATSSVKQRYQNSKILSINLIQSKGPPVYRVKTLSSSGVVKYVFVDGTTGDVFE